jgi:hypothetical protein
MPTEYEGDAFISYTHFENVELDEGRRRRAVLPADLDLQVSRWRTSGSAACSIGCEWILARRREPTCSTPLEELRTMIGPRLQHAETDRPASADGRHPGNFNRSTCRRAGRARAG